MHPFFGNLLSLLEASRYVIIFILAILEGPIVMITCGFLYRLGQFDFVPMYFSLVLGDLTADIGWYILGYFGAGPIVKKWGKFLNITPEIIQKIEKRFRTYQDKILFISKVTMGFGFALATLIVAGILRIQFKRFVALNFLGGLVWTFFLLLLGFFFGNLYFAITKPLKVVFILTAAAVVGIGLYVINRYLVNTEI